jgi:hypothetical protein
MLAKRYQCTAQKFCHHQRISIIRVFFVIKADLSQWILNARTRNFITWQCQPVHGIWQRTSGITSGKLTEPRETHAIPNWMEHNSCWEAGMSSAGQQIPRILLDTKVHSRLHNSLPSASILTMWLQFTTSHPSASRPILILTSHLYLGLLRGYFHSGVSTKSLFEFLSLALPPPPIRATCPINVTLHDLITRITLGTDIWNITRQSRSDLRFSDGDIFVFVGPWSSDLSLSSIEILKCKVNIHHHSIYI